MQLHCEPPMRSTESGSTGQAASRSSIPHTSKALEPGFALESKFLVTLVIIIVVDGAVHVEALWTDGEYALLAAEAGTGHLAEVADARVTGGQRVPSSIRIL